jgi:hypothetical protein
LSNTRARIIPAVEGPEKNNARGSYLRKYGTCTYNLQKYYLDAYQFHFQKNLDSKSEKEDEYHNLGPTFP